MDVKPCAWPVDAFILLKQKSGHSKREVKLGGVFLRRFDEDLLSIYSGELMQQVALLLLLGIPAGFLVWLGFYLYIPFHRSTERRWRDRVLKLHLEARALAAEEQRKLPILDSECRMQGDRLRAQWFEGFLQTISVQQLEGYPGIGPATLGRLEQAGYRSLAHLVRSRPVIAGLGDKRQADIQSAVQGLLREAKSRFDARACSEAQSLAGALQALHAAHEVRKHRSGARILVAQDLVTKLRTAVAMAQGVTFFRYLTAQEDRPLVPQQMLSDPLPDLGANRIPVRTETERAVPVLPTASPVRDQSQRTVGPFESVGGPSTDLFQQALKREPMLAPNSVETVLVTASQSPESLEKKQLLIMELTIQLAYAAARADGRLARKEREVIEEHLRERFGHNSALLNRARALSGHYISAQIDVGACVRQIADIFASEHRTVLMDLVGRIVESSGNVTAREIEFLEKVARRLGVAAPRLAVSSSDIAGSPSGKAAFPATPHLEPRPAVPVLPGEISSTPADRSPTHDDCLAILGIDTAGPLSAELVRRQFNLLRERYAPEKFDAMGPEFVEVARGRLHAIETAASRLLARWDQKLEPDAAPAPSTDLRHNPDLDAVFGV